MNRKECKLLKEKTHNKKLFLSVLGLAYALASKGMVSPSAHDWAGSRGGADLFSGARINNFHDQMHFIENAKLNSKIPVEEMLRSNDSSRFEINKMKFDCVYGALYIFNNREAFGTTPGKYHKEELELISAENLDKLVSLILQAGANMKKTALVDYLKFLESLKEGQSVPQLTKARFEAMLDEFSRKVDEVKSTAYGDNISNFVNGEFPGLLTQVNGFLTGLGAKQVEDYEEWGVHVKTIVDECNLTEKVFDKFDAYFKGKELYKSFGYRVVCDYIVKVFTKMMSGSSTEENIRAAYTYGNIIKLVQKCRDFFAQVKTMKDKTSKKYVENLKNKYASLMFAMGSLRSIMNALITPINSIDLKQVDSSKNAALYNFLSTFKNNIRKGAVDNRTFLDLAVSYYALLVGVMDSKLKPNKDLFTPEYSAERLKLVNKRFVDEALNASFNQLKYFTTGDAWEKLPKNEVKNKDLLTREYTDHGSTFSYFSKIFDIVSNSGGVARKVGSLPFYYDANINTNSPFDSKTPIAVKKAKTDDGITDPKNFKDGSNATVDVMLANFMRSMLTSVDNFNKADLEKRYDEIIKALITMQTAGAFSKLDSDVLTALGSTEMKDFVVGMLEAVGQAKMVKTDADINDKYYDELMKNLGGVVNKQLNSKVASKLFAISSSMDKKFEATATELNAYGGNVVIDGQVGKIDAEHDIEDKRNDGARKAYVDIASSGAAIEQALVDNSALRVYDAITNAHGALPAVDGDPANPTTYKGSVLQLFGLIHDNAADLKYVGDNNDPSPFKNFDTTRANAIHDGDPIASVKLQSMFYKFMRSLCGTVKSNVTVDKGELEKRYDRHISELGALIGAMLKAKKIDKPESEERKKLVEALKNSKNFIIDNVVMSLDKFDMTAAGDNAMATFGAQLLKTLKDAATTHGTKGNFADRSADAENFEKTVPILRYFYDHSNVGKLNDDVLKIDLTDNVTKLQSMPLGANLITGAKTVYASDLTINQWANLGFDIEDSRFDAKLKKDETVNGTVTELVKNIVLGKWGFDQLKDDSGNAFPANVDQIKGAKTLKRSAFLALKTFYDYHKNNKKLVYAYGNGSDLDTGFTDAANNPISIDKDASGTGTGDPVKAYDYEAALGALVYSLIEKARETTYNPGVADPLNDQFDDYVKALKAIAKSPDDAYKKKIDLTRVEKLEKAKDFIVGLVTEVMKTVDMNKGADSNDVLKAIHAASQTVLARLSAEQLSAALTFLSCKPVTAGQDIIKFDPALVTKAEVDHAATFASTVAGRDTELDTWWAAAHNVQEEADGVPDMYSKLPVAADVKSTVDNNATKAYANYFLTQLLNNSLKSRKITPAGVAAKVLDLNDRVDGTGPDALPAAQKFDGSFLLYLKEVDGAFTGAVTNSEAGTADVSQLISNNVVDAISWNVGDTIPADNIERCLYELTLGLSDQKPAYEEAKADIRLSVVNRLRELQAIHAASITNAVAMAAEKVDINFLREIAAAEDLIVSLVAGLKNVWNFAKYHKAMSEDEFFQGNYVPLFKKIVKTLVGALKNPNQLAFIFDDTIPDDAIDIPLAAHVDFTPGVVGDAKKIDEWGDADVKEVKTTGATKAEIARLNNRDRLKHFVKGIQLLRKIFAPAKNKGHVALSALASNVAYGELGGILKASPMGVPVPPPITTTGAGAGAGAIQPVKPLNRKISESISGLNYLHQFVDAGAIAYDGTPIEYKIDVGGLKNISMKVPASMKAPAASTGAGKLEKAVAGLAYSLSTDWDQNFGAGDTSLADNYQQLVDTLKAIKTAATTAGTDAAHKLDNDIITAIEAAKGELVALVKTIDIIKADDDIRKWFKELGSVVTRNEFINLGLFSTKASSKFDDLLKLNFADNVAAVDVTDADGHAVAGTKISELKNVNVQKFDATKVVGAATFNDKKIVNWEDRLKLFIDSIKELRELFKVNHNVQVSAYHAATAGKSLNILDTSELARTNGQGLEAFVYGINKLSNMVKLDVDTQAIKVDDKYLRTTNGTALTEFLSAFDDFGQLFKLTYFDKNKVPPKKLTNSDILKSFIDAVGALRGLLAPKTKNDVDARYGLYDRIADYVKSVAYAGSGADLQTGYERNESLIDQMDTATPGSLAAVLQTTEANSVTYGTDENKALMEKDLNPYSEEVSYLTVDASHENVYKNELSNLVYEGASATEKRKFSVTKKWLEENSDLQALGIKEGSFTFPQLVASIAGKFNLPCSFADVDLDADVGLQVMNVMDSKLFSSAEYLAEGFRNGSSMELNLKLAAGALDSDGSTVIGMGGDKEEKQQLSTLYTIQPHQTLPRIVDDYITVVGSETTADYNAAYDTVVAGETANKAKWNDLRKKSAEKALAEMLKQSDERLTTKLRNRAKYNQFNENLEAELLEKRNRLVRMMNKLRERYDELLATSDEASQTMAKRIDSLNLSAENYDSDWSDQLAEVEEQKKQLEKNPNAVYLSDLGSAGSTTIGFGRARRSLGGSGVRLSDLGKSGSGRPTSKRRSSGVRLSDLGKSSSGRPTSKRRSSGMKLSDL